MLGDDAPLLSDEAVKSHDSLFKKLNSRETIVGEEEDDKELEYLQEIRQVRDEETELFNKIKNLPKKARSCKKSDCCGVISFFRRSDMRKFPSMSEMLPVIKTAAPACLPALTAVSSSTSPVMERSISPIRSRSVSLSIQ